MKRFPWFAQGPACSFRLFVTIEAINLVLTLMLFGLGLLLNNEQVQNAAVQRQDQISYIQASKIQCDLNTKRANAQKILQDHELANQRADLEQGKKDLANIKKLPAFNTPEIRKLAEEAQQRLIARFAIDVAASEALLEAYKPTNCDRFIVPKN